MPRRVRPVAGRGPAPSDAAAPLNAPFKGLRKQVARATAARPVATPVPAASPPPPDDATIFAHAMTGVVRLGCGVLRVDAPAPSVRRSPVNDEDEALIALVGLVSGTTEFDISDTREYVEGTVVGLDPRIVRRLRRGEFAWQAHIDLHGMTAAEARIEVERFLLEAVRTGLRCVLVVHGRGLNSKDQVPVLKERLKSWLSRGRIGRVVLAFTSARPQDGGVGALYVLLRRDRRRRPIEVTEGAKR
jgi:DNA-nicking Smr family endonuclease